MKYERHRKKAEEMDADLTFQPAINKNNKYYKQLEERERAAGHHNMTRDERIDERLYPYHTMRDPENDVEIQISKKYMKALEEIPQDGDKLAVWRDFTRLDVDAFRQGISSGAGSRARSPGDYDYAAPARA